MFVQTMKRIALLIGFISAAILTAGNCKEPTQPILAKKPIGRAELYQLMERACWYGDDQSVQILLDAGADPNGVKDYAEVFRIKRFEPSWPINQASWGGHLEVVELLLKAGAKVDFPEGEGYTALTIATTKNHPKLVQRLLSAGADIDYKTPQGTAYDIAKSKGFADIVKILENHKRSK